MADASIQIGAVLDIATGKEVKDSADRVVSSVGDLFDRSKRLPTFIRRAKSGSLVAASGELILTIGSPPPGKMWMINHLNAVVIQDFTTTALYAATPSVCPFFVGAVPEEVSTIPSMAAFLGEPDGRGILFSRPYPVFTGDTLYCWIQETSMVTNQYTAVALLEEVDVKQGIRGVL